MTRRHARYDEKALIKRAKLFLKLYLLGMVAALLMGERATEFLNKPRGACNMRFCVPLGYKAPPVDPFQ